MLIITIKTRETKMFSKSESPQTLSSNFQLEIISKDTSEYLKKIGKQELVMLVQMLEDLKNPALKGSMSAYGYSYDSDAHVIWDEEKLASYKQNRLQQRFKEKGYTFFCASK